MTFGHVVSLLPTNQKQLIKKQRADVGPLVIMVSKSDTQ